MFCCTETHTTDYELWHRRLGHLNHEDVSATIPGCKRQECNAVCETCVQAKLTRVPVAKVQEGTADKTLHRVVSDVVGPFDTPSLNGHRYAVTFIDEFSRHATVKFMVRKSEVIDKFKEFLAEIGTPKVLRTDNGGEYVSADFRKVCTDNKIRQEFTVPETPEQNGIAERFNRTLVEMARCLLIDSKLPKRYWVRAVATAAHIRNLVSTGRKKSPYELMYNRIPNVRYLKVFGCSAFVLKRKAKLSKLEPKATKAKFIGYSDECKGYILQEFDSRKVVVARHVSFMENEILSLDKSEQIEGSCDFPELNVSGGTVESAPNAGDADEERTEQ